MKRFTKLFTLLFAASAVLATAGSLRNNTSQQFLSAKAPRNYVKNTGAEQNDLNVTDASGIHSRTTTTPIEGDGSHLIDASGSAQVVCFTAEDFQINVTGGSCEASFKYTGDASLYKAYAQLAGTSVSDTTNNQLSNISSGRGVFSANFPCGASTTDDPQVCIESTSASAAAIRVDGVYVGEATNIGTVAQAKQIGAAYFATTGSCSWSRTSTALGDFTSTAACPGPTVEFNTGPGVISTTDTNLPEITISNLPAGEYQVLVSGVALPSAAAVTDYKVSDGTTTSGAGAGPQVAGARAQFVVLGNFSYSSAGSRTFKMVGAASSGNVVITNQSGNESLKFVVTRLPTASETIARLDAPGVGWTAFTPTGSWVSNTTWTGDYICNGSILTVNGKAATSGAPTSATFGVDLPAGFTIDSSAVADTTANFGAIMGQVTVSDGGVTGYKGYLVYSSTTRVVGVYQSATSGVGSLINQAAPITFGASDNVTFTFSVPVTDSSPCPKNPQVLIPGSVYSSSAGIENPARINISGSSGITNCTSTPCTVETSNVPGATIARSTTGTYAITWPTNTYSAKGSCSCSANSVGVAGTRVICTALSSSATNVDVFTYREDTGVLVDTYSQVLCLGPK